MTLRSWVADLPKVELHLHLEGAIPLSTLAELIRRHGEDVDPAALAARFRYSSFDEFIQTWLWKNGYLRTLDDFTHIAEAIAGRLAATNVRYAEAFFSPADFAHHGLEPEGLALALRGGLDRVPEVDVHLIADLVRDKGPEQALAMIDRVAAVADDAGILGIGMGGSEDRFPPGPFAPAYERARAHGLHTAAHAGEVAGPHSVWSALEDLGVERIGHGVRSVEDPQLLNALAERRVPIEVCPLSNVATGVVAAIEDHPIRAMFDAGLAVTVNTDDPGMFGNSMTDDLVALIDHHGFQPAEIRRLTENAVEAVWQPVPDRARLAERIFGDPAWDRLPAG